MSGEITEAGRPDPSVVHKDVSLGGLTTEKPKGLFQAVKSTFARLVQPDKPKLTPEHQAREDLAREVLRASDIKARPEREAAQARIDASAARKAKILADFLNTEPLSKTLDQIHQAREAWEAKQATKIEKLFAEQDKQAELKKQTSLAKTRLRIQKLKEENDAAEGKTKK